MNVKLNLFYDSFNVLDTEVASLSQLISLKNDQVPRFRCTNIYITHLLFWCYVFNHHVVYYIPYNPLHITTFTVIAIFL